MSPEATEIVEGEPVEPGPREHDDAALLPVPVPALAVTPTVTAADLVQRLTVIREAAERAMEDGVDYGKVPGTDKPTLFKPGAEKLSVLFQLDVQLDNEKLWDGPHLTVISRATVFHAPTGSRLGFGEGICSTREKKYAYRNASRTCPECDKPAIIKGKAEYGGGWVCFRRKDGCGTKFEDSDERITRQEIGQVENPDLPDAWNTVVKMAEKRARVDAILAVTGASALFTQDIAEEPAAAEAEAPAPSSPPASVSPRLTEEQQRRVLSAIADCDQNERLLFAAVGVSSSDELTAEHAHQIHALLKEAAVESK